MENRYTGEKPELEVAQVINKTLRELIKEDSRAVSYTHLGMFPDPRLILYGFAVSLLSLLIGTIIFMKKQDKFILYI